MKNCGALVIALVLAACGSTAPEPSPDVATEQASAGVEAERIECAIDGADAFQRDCVLELEPDGEGHILVVRHDDGGFRRFSLRAGELAALDGSLPARQLATGQFLEVGVGNDRYRFPQTLGQDKGP